MRGQADCMKHLTSDIEEPNQGKGCREQKKRKIFGDSDEDDDSSIAMEQDASEESGINQLFCK